MASYLAPRRATQILSRALRLENGHLWNNLTRAALIACLISGGTAILLGTPWMSEVLIGRLQIYPPLTQRDLYAASQNHDAAIVILSAGRRFYAPEFGGVTVDEVALERVRYGAEVERSTGLPILVSGGFGSGTDPPLAKLMADVLAHDYGISVNWMETRSTNTAENAIYSSAILKQAGVTRVLLVTHAWHMKRARAAFVANGMTVVAAPTAFYGVPTHIGGGFTPTARAFRMSNYAIHETLGSAWYSLKYGY